ncbi:MAG: hypothetical protein HZB41_01230 [Ignavibacteriae bacterium]|nr:hypothetical protein [Ignavibacteriota bacterium]
MINHKVRDREKNWKGLLSQLDKIIHSKDSRIIWFHASSMGEFEQAKPVIEFLKINEPKIKVIVTFYSPSGYNNQKKYNFADSILYMPFDSMQRAKKLIELIKPDFAVFVRYEIWRNHLWILKQKNISSYLICATAPQNTFLMKYPVTKSLLKSNYNLFDTIYTVSENETKQFRKLKVRTKIITASDTRFDRIINKVNESKLNPILPKELFKDNKLILVAGSTWEPDEEIIINSIVKFEKENHGDIRLILVPHEPTEKHIEKVKKLLPNSFLLSEIQNFLSFEREENEINNFLGWNHIIVDSIGYLLRLYSLADAAYIGGGLGVGVHSVTEPAGYGIPIAAGPKYQNSPDAVSLRNNGALTIIQQSEDFYNWIIRIRDSAETRAELGTMAFQYINNRIGSTELIAETILKHL